MDARHERDDGRGEGRDEERDIKIASLQATVRALQVEMAERVRSYLLQAQAGGRRRDSPTHSCQFSKGVQTDTEKSLGWSRTELYNLDYTPEPSVQGGQEEVE